MVAEPSISRKALLQGAGAIGVGFIATEAANAASFDPNTGFPTNKGGSKSQLCNGSADKGCQPMTQAASITDKQKAILAGSITVAANKLSILDAELETMKKSAKKKKPAVLDAPFVFRYSALYLTPLADSMTQYCARDAQGSKMAGGGGFPKMGGADEAAAKQSSLYKYVEEVNKGIASISAAAKAGSFEDVSAGGKAVKAAADAFLAAANAPVIFN